jgi:hypothetical protein
LLAGRGHDHAFFKTKEDGDWFLIPHPEDKVVGLWLEAGQDGQWLYWSGIHKGCLHVERKPSLAATGPPVFHPAGGEFLAYGVDEGSLRRHRFPSSGGSDCSPERMRFRRAIPTRIQRS